MESEANYVRKEWSSERKGDPTQTNKSRNLGRYNSSLIMNVERLKVARDLTLFRLLPQSADLAPTPRLCVATVSWADQGGKPGFLQGVKDCPSLGRHWQRLCAAGGCATSGVLKHWSPCFRLRGVPRCTSQ